MKGLISNSDARLKASFVACTLDPADFSDEAHLRSVWIDIIAYGIEGAIEEIRDQLLRFVSFVGEGHKYNKTLTIAATRIVYHFMLRSKSDDFNDLIEEFPQLKHDFKGLLASHYSNDIFRSEEARSKYLEPDLLAFD